MRSKTPQPPVRLTTRGKQLWRHHATRLRKLGVQEFDVVTFESYVSLLCMQETITKMYAEAEAEQALNPTHVQYLSSQLRANAKALCDLSDRLGFTKPTKNAQGRPVVQAGEKDEFGNFVERKGLGVVG